MKHILVGFFIAYALVNASSVAYGGCPVGFTPHTFTSTFTYHYPPPSIVVFVCEVEITYCCKWDNVQKKVIVQIDEFHGANGSNCPDAVPNWADFTNWLNEEIAYAATQTCMPEFPPLPPTRKTEVEYWITPCFTVPCPSN